jgi:hypothetical protein
MCPAPGKTCEGEEDRGRKAGRSSQQNVEAGLLEVVVGAEGVNEAELLHDDEGDAIG